jgi:hypothetical protein
VEEREDGSRGVAEAHPVTIITGRIGNISDTPSGVEERASVRRARSSPNVRPEQNLGPILVRGVKLLQPRYLRLPHVVLVSVLAWTGLASQAFAQVPRSFPQGHHNSVFLQNRTTFVPTQGWDPAQVDVSNANKRALVTVFQTKGCSGGPCSTYNVGLPAGVEANGLDHEWTFGNAITPSVLDAAISARAPGLSIMSPNPSGITGKVYHIDNYEFCPTDWKDGCNSVTVAGGNIVITRSAFGMISSQSDRQGNLFILDSLLDAKTGAAAGVNTWGGMTVMYSEILGGADSAKLSSDQVFYRNHIHGPTLQPGGHSDGVQLHSGSSNVFFIENLVDHLYRKHNGAYWAKSTGACNGQAYLYRNLFGGGLRSTWFAAESNPWCPGTANVMKDNLYFSTASNMSQGTDGIKGDGSNHSSSAPMRGSGNVDMDGRTVSVGGGAPTPADDAAVANKIAQLENWAAQMRAAAGYSGPPPAQNPTAPAAPVLLD